MVYFFWVIFLYFKRKINIHPKPILSPCLIILTLSKQMLKLKNFVGPLYHEKQKLELKVLLSIIFSLNRYETIAIPPSAFWFRNDHSFWWMFEQKTVGCAAVTVTFINFLAMMPLGEIKQCFALLNDKPKVRNIFSISKCKVC